MLLNTLQSTKNIKLITVFICFCIIIALQNIMPLTRVWIVISVFTGLSIHGYVVLQWRLKFLPRYGLIVLPIIILILLNIAIKTHYLILSIQAVSFMVLGFTLITTFVSRSPRHR